jgi:hypothetical protein
VLKCVVDHILQEFNTPFLARFRTYKIASPTPNKVTSKDDIKGVVSLKFLRPCGQQFTKLGRKYQHDYLYLQSLNFDKHLPQNTFTGQYF